MARQVIEPNTIEPNTADAPAPETRAKPKAAAASLKALRTQMVRGGITLLVSTGLVGLMNLAHNVAVARLLGPTGYGHAAVVFTLLMLVSAITLAFQILCAKLIAGNDVPADRAGIYKRLHRMAWVAGIAIGLILIAVQGPISSFLNLPNRFLIVLLGLGTAFYIPLGVRRGYIQGICEFASLARNFLFEGFVRLAGALMLIALGMGVRGAVEASVVAIIGAYALARPGLISAKVNDSIRVPFREAMQAMAFFAGQVIINNFDIIMVKHFFPSEEAGLYAAVALVGRLVNVCSWAVVNSMFPVSVKQSAEKKDTSLLMISLGLVLGVLAVLIGGLLLMPNFLWRVLYGAQFNLEGYGRIAVLVVLYAVTSGVYALSSVVIAYEISRKIANTSWIQLAFSGAVIAGIDFFHADLFQVIMVQLILMSLLLVTVVTLFAVSFLQSSPEASGYSRNIRYLRPLSEDEVIADFLASEFHHAEFAQYRETFKSLVNKPNFDDPRENNLRRSLLFLRRGAMWRELPSDTRWFEVEMTPGDIDNIQVFPRAQWRRVAQGSFGLAETVERIRSGPRSALDRDFFSKLHSLSPLVRKNMVSRAVLLIGTDKDAPLTILDGNHRITTAMLIDPAMALKQFRLICGFSERMTECCWYKTNLATLSRYGANMLRYMFYDPRRELTGFMEGRKSGA